MPNAAGELSQLNSYAFRLESRREDEMQLRFGLLAGLLVAAAFLSPVSALAASAPSSDPDWSKIVAAAKKEAKIVIIGPSGSDVRDDYTIGFQKKYQKMKVVFN